MLDPISQNAFHVTQRTCHRFIRRERDTQRFAQPDSSVFAHLACRLVTQSRQMFEPHPIVSIQLALNQSPIFFYRTCQFGMLRYCAFGFCDGILDVGVPESGSAIVRSAGWGKPLSRHARALHELSGLAG